MAQKIERGKIKPQQMEHFTRQRVEEAFEDKSIPEAKVNLDGILAKIDEISGGGVIQQVIPINETQKYVRIKHGLNRKPVVKVLNDKQEEVIVDIIYADDNTIEVIFTKSINGQIIIN